MKLLSIKSIKTLKGIFKDFTFAGFVTYSILRWRKREILVAGSCKCCGACCRSLSLDDGNGWIRDPKDFWAIVKEKPQYGCFEIVGKDNSGYVLFRCTLVLEDGRCGKYEERFQFCHDFPDRNLPFCGGKLPAGCGYVFQSVEPFAKVLNETIDRKDEKNSHT